MQGLRTFLRAQADDGRTVLVSSHLLAEVSHTVDHVVIIDKGRLLAHAPLAELTSVATEAVVVRTPETAALLGLLLERGVRAERTGPDEVSAAGATPDEVGQAIAFHGIVVHAMHAEESSLEDVFFRLTEGSRSWLA